MSKALIIKGADFSTNKVTTITFGSVPCEGISFASDTITITDQNPVTVEYTLTPSNTTDIVEWASSDTDVVTVSGGVLTVIGIGTATLTATCGNYTATATVTVNIAYIPSWEFGYPTHADPYLFAGFELARSRIASCGSGVQKAEHNFAARTLCPVKLPKNTKRVRVSRGTDVSLLYNDAHSGVVWMKDAPCGDTNYPTATTYISANTGINFRTNQTLMLTVPDTADAMCFYTRLIDNQAEGVEANTIAQSIGITIEFLTAE